MYYQSKHEVCVTLIKKIYLRNILWTVIMSLERVQRSFSKGICVNSINITESIFLKSNEINETLIDCHQQSCSTYY